MQPNGAEKSVKSALQSYPDPPLQCACRTSHSHIRHVRGRWRSKSGTHLKLLGSVKVAQNEVKNNSAYTPKSTLKRAVSQPRDGARSGCGLHGVHIWTQYEHRLQEPLRCHVWRHWKRFGSILGTRRAAKQHQNSVETLSPGRQKEVPRPSL